MSKEKLAPTAAEREELIEALQYPTKWRDKGMPTEQVVERATGGHESAQVVDEYLLPVISRILAARCAELEAEIHRLHVSEHNAALDGHENASERDDALAECVMLREQLRLQTDRAAALQATLDRVSEVYGFLMRKYADPDADAATVLAVTRTSLRAALTPEGKACACGHRHLQGPGCKAPGLCGCNESPEGTE